MKYRLHGGGEGEKNKVHSPRDIQERINKKLYLYFW